MMELKSILKRMLEDLEDRVDVAEERRIHSNWRGFWDGTNESGKVFCPGRTPIAQPAFALPGIRVNAAIEDETFVSMLIQQLEGVYATLTGTFGAIPMIRTNYGSNLISTLLGAQLHMMEDQYNILPGALPVEGGVEGIKRLIARGVPDLRGGQGGKVLDCLAFFQEQLKDYPRVREWVKIYHPDAQGTFDICEVCWGSDIYLDFYDVPEVVGEFLDLIVETYCAFMDRWFELSRPAADGFGYHYGWMHKGLVRLSLDSCVNLSPELYEEQIKARDARMLQRYGGVIHSCGHVDHFVGCLADLPNFYGFNYSQPDLNNQVKIFDATLAKGIRLLGMGIPASTLAKGRTDCNLMHAIEIKS